MERMGRHQWGWICMRGQGMYGLRWVQKQQECVIYDALSGLNLMGEVQVP